MEKWFLESAQMLKEHPILAEKISYKIRYINVLEYFFRKYSEDDIWANAMLQLYKKKLLNNTTDYTYGNVSLSKYKGVVATKFKPFKFFSYRYCLIFDCIFINAYGDRKKGEEIFDELVKIYNKRYEKNMRQVFEFLYNPKETHIDLEQIQYMKACWNKNRQFVETEPVKIIVTAAMSAGKSTLLNALIGKKVNRTQNDSCTAKLHYIVNKPFEDDLCYELDHALELDADDQTLMEDNANNENNEIVVGTYFRSINENPKRLWFVDTPGFNSSLDAHHKQITENVIQTEKTDMLIYLLNGENLGTYDDRNHLEFIADNYHGKIVFVVNKVDRFRKKEDSVPETLETLAKDLERIGFKTPFVVPVSSYAAYLAKKDIFGEDLDEDELDEFERLKRKLQRPEYQFDAYYPIDAQKSVRIKNDSDNYQLLLHSGILQLETIIYNLR